VKILAITSSYPRYEDDATAPFVESIVRGVASLGHEVHVLVPENRDWDRAANDGPVHHHVYRYSPARTWTPWGFSASLDGGARIRKSLYALAPIVLASATRAGRRLVDARGFDVIHVHWVVPNGPVGALVSRGRFPLVVSLHGSDLAVSERSPLARRSTRWTFERAAAVSAPSRDLLGRASRLGASSLELVPYGADVDALVAPSGMAVSVRERLGIAQDEMVVMGIGRLIPVKGFDVLVDAFALAASRLPGLRLVLVGAGAARADLERQADRLSLRDRVVFAGEARRDEIAGYLAAADVVAVPSVRHGGYVDGLPNVALEALAAARPLVASNVGGLPELVRPEINGLLVDERDSRALADAIVRLAGDEALRARLGSAGQEEIRAHRSWGAVAARFVEIYERVVHTG
jgi:glycosyltransferase involved in cell wall biosynthesis